jgi:putative transcriptional regulator
MSQDRQLQLVTSVMITAGFDVSERFTIRPRSFDLIARNNGTLLIIKVVAHIDSVSEEVAFDIEADLAPSGGIPLIVGGARPGRRAGARCGLRPVRHLRDQPLDTV